MHHTIKHLTFPDLPYAFDALEPHIDARTMEIHFTKHHQAYYNNLMNAANGTDIENMSLEELLKGISSHPTVVRNNGGGHFNHNLFWQIMSPTGGGQAKGDLASAIDRQFGSFEDFKGRFNQAAATRFGSGWAWLCVKSDNSLEICSTPNQDNPLMDLSECRGIPILGLDVWEHAYYLHYQNRRPDYISAFWNVVNWDEVERRYSEALTK